MIPTRTTAIGASLVAAAMLVGCAGEGSSVAPQQSSTGDPEAGWSADTLDIDFATYNPLSLIIKEQGWLEDATAGEVAVNWVQSTGSNKANELLRAGAADVASTAGSAALLARANGLPIRTIDVYSQPNWSAILVPAASEVTEVSQLQGASIAATKGTDPYFFLLQSLAAGGLTAADVRVQNLQHADGLTALQSGAVEAWSGLDPMLSSSLADGSARVVYDNIDFNSYGFLNATEEFLEASPDLAQLVVDAYERAREFAIAEPEETASILAEVAGIDPEVATAVIRDRTNFELDPAPGDAQRQVLEFIGPIFVESGDVTSQDAVDAALDSLFEPRFADAADPGSFS
ncbi:aliphatic sulfonate ABC transporter substrate-binding protein [Agrococcus sp. ProA11]|uniref:aliphatic sulfonate ABC transporter substrate-binding protein n=1 Tax=Agrococcus chionoecetis TaxID=3153752 RepID=UPI003260078A